MIFEDALAASLVQGVDCRLHGVEPYTYLVDVLQRISEHPAKHDLVREPDAGEPPVRFDERELET